MTVTPEQALAVRCPFCGADVGEQCELSTGRLRRDYPHRDREWAAKDLILGKVVSTSAKAPMVKKPLDDYASLERTIKFYEWALANYAEFQLTERKPRTKANLQKRLLALQDELHRVK